MDTYNVKPIFIDPRPDFSLTVSAPGSKSITNRALMIAALAEGTSRLSGVLFSDDSRHFLSCLQDLGFDLEINEALCEVRIQGCGGQIPKKEAAINVGSAGTAARFLTAMLGMAGGTYHLDASEQMRKRPMAPLLKAMRALGCEITCEGEADHFPFTITSSGVKASEAQVNIDDSSQFLSALLMAGVSLDHDFTINVTGSHGMAYVDMTAEMMRRFGANVAQPDARTYVVSGACSYQARDYMIEPDVSAAAYFYGMALLSGGNVLVRGVHSDSLQGDLAVLDAFCRMGCRKKEEPEGIRLYGAENALVHGIDIDMHTFSDQALTIAAIAPYADAPVTIRNVAHIRLQECDRMAAIVSELSRMGIDAEADGTDIIIRPGDPKPALIETYGDHRVAMAFALTGLRAEGIVIKDPLCCRKTFENYFKILDEICR